MAYTGLPDEGVVEIVVSDSGIGISAEDQLKIFDSFVQADGGLNRPHEGTGLGLALVARMVELHGGSVVVESKLNEGSQFIVRLPWQPELGKQDETEIVIAANPPYQAALLIEDSAIDAKLMATYLNNLNVSVSHFHDGDNIIQHIRSLRPDIIVLDILLPKRSGWQLLVDIKAEEDIRHIPVLVVSHLDQVEKGTALGADGYLIKPITEARLADEMHRLAARQLDEAHAVLMSSGAPRILLAEDNEATILFIRDFFESKNYDVVVARNGREAVAIAKETLPDLIMMDVQMPEMDGLAAIRQLRKDERFAKTPIFAVTALAMAGDRERCLAAGANEYLSKPVSLTDLQRQVVTWLVDKRGENQVDG